jgi:hypothetical protein
MHLSARGKTPLSGGIALLDGTERAAAADFFRSLAEYGIFVVDRGELTDWAPTLGTGVHKSNWLPEVFAKMGEDPDSPEYLKPGTDDVLGIHGSGCSVVA